MFSRSLAMKLNALLASIVAAGLALGGVAAVSSPVFADPPADKGKDHKDHKHDAKGDDKGKGAEKGRGDDKKAASGVATVGETAPAFTLTDTEGKTVNLAEVGKGKIVVLEWFNAECPFVVKHHTVNPTFGDLYKDFKDKGVVFLAINSGAEGKQGGGKEKSIAGKKELKVDFPVLLDTDGKVGKAYGAKRTPDVFIIDKDGKVAYIGAVCNNSDGKKVGDKNYVRLALEELTAGKPVTTKQTERYGCSVKYGN
jgi:peroxiredoxin